MFTILQTMRKILAMVAVLAGVAMADGPIDCRQVEKYVVTGISGCRCIIHDVGVFADSVQRRNIVQFCGKNLGRSGRWMKWMTSVQMRITNQKWFAYEIDDCTLLEDDKNVSCKGENFLDDDDEPQYVSTDLDKYLLFLYGTYGKKKVDYLMGVK